MVVEYLQGTSRYINSMFVSPCLLCPMKLNWDRIYALVETMYFTYFQIWNFFISYMDTFYKFEPTLFWILYFFFIILTIIQNKLILTIKIKCNDFQQLTIIYKNIIKMNKQKKKEDTAKMKYKIHITQVCSFVHQ